MKQLISLLLLFVIGVINNTTAASTTTTPASTTAAPPFSTTSTVVSSPTEACDHLKATVDLADAPVTIQVNATGGGVRYNYTQSVMEGVLVRIDVPSSVTWTAEVIQTNGFTNNDTFLVLFTECETTYTPENDLVTFDDASGANRYSKIEVNSVPSQMTYYLFLAAFDEGVDDLGVANITFAIPSSTTAPPLSTSTSTTASSPTETCAVENIVALASNTEIAIQVNAIGGDVSVNPICINFDCSYTRVGVLLRVDVEPGVAWSAETSQANASANWDTYLYLFGNCSTGYTENDSIASDDDGGDVSYSRIEVDSVLNQKTYYLMLTSFQPSPDLGVAVITFNAIASSSTTASPPTVVTNDPLTTRGPPGPDVTYIRDTTTGGDGSASTTTIPGAEDASTLPPLGKAIFSTLEGVVVTTTRMILGLGTLVVTVLLLFVV